MADKKFEKTDKLRVLFMHFNGEDEVGDLNTLYTSFFQDVKNIDVIETIERTTGKMCVFNDVYYIDESKDPMVKKINYFINNEKRSIKLFRTTQQALKATSSFDDGYLLNSFSTQILVVPIVYDDDEHSFDMVSATSGIEDISFESVEKIAFMYSSEEIDDVDFKNLKKLLQKKYKELKNIIKFDGVESLTQLMNGKTINYDNLAISYNLFSSVLSIESPKGDEFEIPSEVLVNNIPFIAVENVKTLKRMNMRSAKFMFKALGVMAKHVSEDNEMSFYDAMGILNRRKIAPSYIKHFEKLCRGQTSISVDLGIKNPDRLKNYISNSVFDNPEDNVIEIDEDQVDNDNGGTMFNEEALNAELSSDMRDSDNIRRAHEEVDIYLSRLLPIFVNNMDAYLTESFGEGNYVSALENDAEGIYALNDFATKYTRDTQDEMIDEIVIFESQVDQEFMAQTIPGDSDDSERSAGNCVTYGNAYVIKDSKGVESVRMFILKFDYHTIKSRKGKRRQAEIATCAYSQLLAK